MTIFGSGFLTKLSTASGSWSLPGVTFTASFRLLDDASAETATVGFHNGALVSRSDEFDPGADITVTAPKSLAEQFIRGQGALDDLLLREDVTVTGSASAMLLMYVELSSQEWRTFASSV